MPHVPGVVAERVCCHNNSGPLHQPRHVATHAYAKCLPDVAVRQVSRCRGASFRTRARVPFTNVTGLHEQAMLHVNEINCYEETIHQRLLCCSRMGAACPYRALREGSMTQMMHTACFRRYLACAAKLSSRALASFPVASSVQLRIDANPGRVVPASTP